MVVLLGTGMPRLDPAASGPATAIVVGDRVFLVDAGPGVERQLSAAHLPINGVTALFITHLLATARSAISILSPPRG
jgi:ribonuclease BN (tRNA processing enzyme)